MGLKNLKAIEVYGNKKNMIVKNFSEGFGEKECQIKDKTGLFFNNLKDKSGLPKNSKKV